MKRERRVAREIALKTLFQMEMDGDPLEALEDYFSENRLPEEIKSYARTLVDGVVKNREEIDRRISSSTRKKFAHLLPIEKTILRIATYEMLNGIKPAIAMDEAVELAKKYGEATSYKLINGILDSLHRENAS